MSVRTSITMPKEDKVKVCVIIDDNSPITVRVTQDDLRSIYAIITKYKPTT